VASAQAALRYGRGDGGGQDGYQQHLFDFGGGVVNGNGYLDALDDDRGRRWFHRPRGLALGAIRGVDVSVTAAMNRA